jgi:hypothetical protein
VAKGDAAGRDPGVFQQHAIRRYTSLGRRETEAMGIALRNGVLDRISRWGTAAILMLAVAAGAIAQDDLEKPPPIPPAEEGDVPIPPKLPQEQIEPTVTIREEENRLIEEYRMNGRVYMVKITPKGGIPYYYIDADGDGELELSESSRVENPVQPVYWKIKEWK